MIFTDERGQRWEVSDEWPVVPDGAKLIRPIPDKPKWQVGIQNDGDIWITHDLPRDQAQLIKDCCEKMMEYVMGGADFKNSYFSEVPLLVETHNAIQKGAK